MYRFPKGSLIHPVVTIILYCGTESWDGPRTLHEMIDFSDMPHRIQEIVPDYRMNFVEVKKLEDTEVFRTDVRHVFNFIRCSEDKAALRALVENEPYYKEMEEDAFDLVACYAGSGQLIEAKDYNRKDGKINMCTAIKEMIEEGKAEGGKEGKAEGRIEGRKKEKVRIVRKMIFLGMPEQEICNIVGCSMEFVRKVRQTMQNML